MSDFAARMVTRTTGATGIQPRIAPITAPDPWHEPLDLELATIERTAVHDDVRGAMQPNPPAAPRPPRPQRMLSEVEGVEVVEHEMPVPARVIARTVEPVAARARDLRADASRLVADDRPRREPTLDLRDSPRIDSTMRELSVPTVERPVEATDEHELTIEATRGPSPARVVPSLRARLPDLGQRELPSTRMASSDGPSIVEVHREMDSIEPSSDTQPTTAPEPARRSSVAAPSSMATPIDPTRDVPRPPRRRESAREGVVRVEIGRVELRSAPSSEPVVDRGVPKPETFVSLKQYLRERGGT